MVNKQFYKFAIYKLNLNNAEQHYVSVDGIGYF